VTPNVACRGHSNQPKLRQGASLRGHAGNNHSSHRGSPCTFDG
jgi:hypothetical protein